MSWKNYKKAASTVKLTLEEVDAPGFWIELLDIKSMTTAQVQEKITESRMAYYAGLDQLQADLSQKVIGPAMSETIDEIEQERLTAEISSNYSASTFQAPELKPDNQMLIQAWNLTDFDTDELLPPPNDNPGVMKRIPAAIVVWLDGKLDEFWSEFASGPKAPENS